MKIGKKFNQLSLKDYFKVIDNHKKYTDFNTLGLYRSIVENEKLNLEQKKELRDYANQFFGKTFEFLQIKDPGTYFELVTLGQEFTKAEYWQFWKDVRKYQEKILKEKKIKHRSFGVYSKHVCGYDKCPYNGVMFQSGSWFLEGEIYFNSDHRKFGVHRKSERIKKERKNIKKLITKRAEGE